MSNRNRIPLALVLAATIASAFTVQHAFAQATTPPGTATTVPPTTTPSTTTAPTTPTAVPPPATPNPDPAMNPAVPPAVPPSPTANTTATLPSPNPAAPATTPVTPAPGEPNPPGSLPQTEQFAKLDMTHKGYLNRVDVASDSYLSANFQRCDSNGDGRLSESEVAICTRGIPSTKQ